MSPAPLRSALAIVGAVAVSVPPPGTRTFHPVERLEVDRYYRNRADAKRARKAARGPGFSRRGSK